MVRNSRHLVFLQKQIIKQVKHSNTYYIIGVRMQVPKKKIKGAYLVRVDVQSGLEIE